MQKKRLLVVDDDAVIRRAVVNCLADDPNTEVATFSSSGEVLQHLARGERADRLLVDWNMPGLDGFELVVTLRTDRRFDYIRILMLTCETSLERVSRALAAGANDYLMKPFTKEMLLSKLALLDLE